MARLIFGCGYLGLRVARLWRSKGHEVYTVTRSAARVASLQEDGLRPIVADVTEPRTLQRLPTTECVLFSVGYDKTSGLPISEVYVDGLKNTLAALPTATGRFLYVSSTGVYGQNDGGWVDEQSLCEPIRDGGRACLGAEEALLQSTPLGRRCVVLRMAGIYGPGRIPRRRDLEAGKPIAAPAEGYLNLIHVDDAAQAVSAAERAAVLPNLVCVSDGCPVVRDEYYRYLARLIGAPEPTFTQPAADSHAAQRALSSKRVRNSYLLNAFSFQLKYKTYRDGLAAITAAEKHSQQRRGPQSTTSRYE